MAQDLELLAARAVLPEYEFKSGIPLMARLRAAWYAMAAKWAIRYLSQCQSNFNAAVVVQLQTLRTHQADANERSVMSDQDLVQLTRVVAELSQQVIHLQKTLAVMQARIPDDEGKSA